MATGQQGITSQNPDSSSYRLTEKPSVGQQYFNLENLLPGSDMYDQIKIDFVNAGLEVEKVERLVNARLVKRYLTQRDELLERTSDPNFKLNERFLYHGTSAVKTYICEEGLDFRVSKKGCFGRGIYFSDYPRKCVKYAEKEGSKEHIILLMRVILGDSKVYPKGKKDKDLVREPEKHVPYTGFRYYDSVQGCPVNHKEFVVYENSRALVECIITYRKPQNPAMLASPQFQGHPTDHSVDQRSSPATLLDSDTSSDEEDAPNRVAEASSSSSSSDDEEDPPPPTKGDPIEEHLQQLEQDFHQKTKIKDKHLIQTYLLMADLDIDKAIKLSKEADSTIPPGNSQDDYMAKMAKEMKPKKANPILHVDSEGWRAMSQANREEATQCLIDNFLEVIGKEKEDQDARILGRRYLQAVEMNLDLAIISYYEELAGTL